MAEMFLKIEGVTGESQDEAKPISHKHEIEVKQWAWITTNTVRWDMNQGGQSMKVNVNEVIVDKLADLATVTLYQFCVTGKHFKTAKLTCRKNNGDEKVEYLVLDMEDVMVSAVSFAGAGEEVQVTEQVKLSFAQYKLTYKLQDDLGQGTTSPTFGYNIQKMIAA